MQALKGGRRERVELATKFGVSIADGKMQVRGEPAYVRAACEASLIRLDVDCIDLYYQHRVDTRVPIEVTVGSLFSFITVQLRTFPNLPMENKMSDFFGCYIKILLTVMAPALHNIYRHFWN